MPARVPALGLTLALGLGLIVATMTGGCPGDGDDDATPVDDDDNTAPVDADGDGYDTTDDCDDTDPDVHPGADEGCDGIDTDCDGALNSDEIDDDGDGYADCAGDCDDTDPDMHPGAEEGCDGVDTDCDGGLGHDEIDSDGDGFTECADDCDDVDATVYPGAPELCDGLDNDCDPGTDELVDDDGDGYTECDGDCDDTTILAFPGNPEVCRDHVDNDCDGTGNQCDLVGDISLADADAILVGEHADDGAGSALVACDLNGDGLDDLIVGAEGVDSDGGAPYIGTAYAVTAPFSGVTSLADADARLIGIDQFDGIGDSVACGDVNGDGIGDLLTTGMNTFGAYVLFGPVDGVGTVSIDEADAEMYGSTGFGIEVESGFDNNHDGIDDILLLDSFASHGGMAYLYQGPIVGEVTSYVARFDGPWKYDNYMNIAAPVGDLDGDGNVDFVFGSVNENMVWWVLLGPLTGTLDETDAVSSFICLDGQTDYCVRGLSGDPGDYDGDGLDDLILNDASYDDNRGAALVFLGVPGTLSGPGITGGEADVFFEAEQYDNGSPGMRTTFSGDVDGDGAVDLVVGYSVGNVGGYRTGTVYLVTEHPTGTQQLADSVARFIGEAESDGAGWSVEAGGDVNGDGFGDFWASSQSARSGIGAGAVYLILGNGK